MATIDRASTVAKRFVPLGEDGDFQEEDTFIEVECSGEPYVDLHISPRTDITVTCSMTPAEAWRLCRELARTATEAEDAA